jgi:histidyl-tRNA synthetase
VYVAAAEQGLEREVFALAHELREAGVSVVYDAEGRRLKAQLKLASAAGHRLVAVLGPDELAARTVQLRDMRAREQTSVARGELVARVRGALHEAPAPGAPVPPPVP